MLINLYKGGCLWIWTGCQNVTTTRYQILAISILLGASSSTHQTWSLAMIARLVGSDIGNS